MGIKIRASENGYHLLTAASRVLAPSISLSESLNIEGKIVQSETINTWETRPVGDAGLVLELIADTAPLSTASQYSADVSFVGAILYRVEDGTKIEIAQIEFETRLVVEATFEVIEGEGVWSAAIADEVAQIIKTDGLSFLGGKGVDVFQPDNEPIYYTQQTVVRLRGGDDIATGTTGNDHIHGGQGDDVITDLSGQNRLHGGNGDDILTLGNDSDHSTALGGRGDDIITSDHGHDTLIGGADNDQIFGNNGQDILKGGNGNDQIFGGAGEDILKGGKGNDVLTGGFDNDLLIGGQGADTFVFYQNSDGIDTIKDFEVGIDHIFLPDFIGGYEDLTIIQQGKSAIITIENETFEVELKNVDAANLDADDFIFA